jgi:multidrug efflux system outer membrane protein
LVNYLEAVDAERQRLQAERGAVQVLSNRLISTVLLIKALGGAWD